jgi:hypothetical protein
MKSYFIGGKMVLAGLSQAKSDESQRIVQAVLQNHVIRKIIACIFIWITSCPALFFSSPATANHAAYQTKADS